MMKTIGTVKPGAEGMTFCQPKVKFPSKAKKVKIPFKGCFYPNNDANPKILINCNIFLRDLAIKRHDETR